MAKPEFVDGVLLCLEVLCMHDQPTIAGEIIGEIVCMGDLEAAVKRTGSESDQRTVQWLKDNGIN